MLEIKNVIKVVLFTFFTLLILFVIIREVTDKRPIKFESYGSDSDSFREAMQKKFPVGSNVDEAIEILVASGIQKIEIRDVSDKPDTWTRVKGSKYLIDCDYYADLISLNPKRSYSVSFFVDKDRKVLLAAGSSMWFLGEFWI